jgi:hypothetical protein
MVQDHGSHKILNIILQNSIPIWWSFCKIQCFLRNFLWALLVRKVMNGRERFYRGEKEGEEVIDGREVEEKF